MTHEATEPGARPARHEDDNGGLTNRGGAMPGQAPVIIQTSAAPRSFLGTIMQVVGLLILLTILGGMALLMWTVASLASLPSQVAGGVGSQVSGAAAEAARAVDRASRAVRDATDPARPPTGLDYDTPFVALRVLSVGDQLVGGGEYVLTVKEVRRRDDGERTETSLYAVIHAELRQPRETRVLGQVVRTDRDERDHPVYTGESFRIGRASYRVNWVSREQNQMAIGTYRYADAATGPLKFEYE